MHEALTAAGWEAIRDHDAGEPGPHWRVIEYSAYRRFVAAGGRSSVEIRSQVLHAGFARTAFFKETTMNKKRDLHALISHVGLTTVARTLDRTERSTENVRSGQNPLTVDDLYRLMRAYPDFSAELTIMRIGATRASRKAAP
jgi:hypothetical protein